MKLSMLSLEIYVVQLIICLFSIRISNHDLGINNFHKNPTLFLEQATSKPSNYWNISQFLLLFFSRLHGIKETSHAHGAIHCCRNYGSFGSNRFVRVGTSSRPFPEIQLRGLLPGQSGSEQCCSSIINIEGCFVEIMNALLKGQVAKIGTYLIHWR